MIVIIINHLLSSSLSLSLFCCLYFILNSNVASAGMLGYIGIAKGILGVPFINPYQLYTFRNPAIIGSAVYGAIGGAMALLEGKTL